MHILHMHEMPPFMISLIASHETQTTGHIICLVIYMVVQCENRCVYLLAVGEGFGAGRVTVPHSAGPILWKAPPFQQKTTQVVIAISLLIAR